MNMMNVFMKGGSRRYDSDDCSDDDDDENYYGGYGFQVQGAGRRVQGPGRRVQGAGKGLKQSKAFKQGAVSIRGAPSTSRRPPTFQPPSTSRQPSTFQPPSTSRPPSTFRPEVFISYQWGSQGVVLELKQRLEKYGINCWMDTSQMGGGDALFKEIDAGISASKVVICCVTQKYCQSENCQREATLADSRKKPIIPLLFEDITWPPAGQLALVFAKLLYIKMVPALKAVRSNKLKEVLQKIQCHI